MLLASLLVQNMLPKLPWWDIEWRNLLMLAFGLFMETGLTQYVTSFLLDSLSYMKHLNFIWLVLLFLCWTHRKRFIWPYYLKSLKPSYLCKEKIMFKKKGINFFFGRRWTVELLKKNNILCRKSRWAVYFLFNIWCKESYAITSWYDRILVKQ